MIKTTLSEEVLNKYKNSYFCETGTANGDCVNLALNMGFDKVYSIELDEELQKQNKKKYNTFILENRLELITGDSLTELKNIIPSLNKNTTFWLDAHVDFGPCGIKKCPLYEELYAIGTSDIKSHTILIDDMRILGSHWGENIYLDELKKLILNINSNYKISFEDGWEKNDILVAKI